MDGWHGTQIPRSQLHREQLAKEWLLRLIERTPLADLSELPVAWIVAEAPPLIAEILARLERGDAGRTSVERQESLIESLAQLRTGERAAEQIPQDIALLQALLVESLQRASPGSRGRGFPQAAERLAEIFGEIQGSVTRSLIAAGRSAEPKGGKLPGPSGFEDWLGALLAQQQRHGHGFALALFDVDGLGRINEAYGVEAGDRLVNALGDVIAGQVRATDRAFRLDDDEFAVLAPYTDVGAMMVMAERVAELIDSSQAPGGARIAVAAGVVACPGDGEGPEELLESATAATYAAKAASRSVATNPVSTRAALQDP